jgi:hypothetical protein
MCSRGPAAYPNIFGDGTPPPAIAVPAEAPGTQIAMHHMTTVANATARNLGLEKNRPRRRPRSCPVNEPGMFPSKADGAETEPGRSGPGRRGVRGQGMDQVSDPPGRVGL